MINFIEKQYNFTDYTVILPSIGVGNVSQLSIDLLISTLRMKRIGFLWHPAIISIIGPIAYDHDDADQTAAAEEEEVEIGKKGHGQINTTACDLYIDENKKILVFQIRSSLVPALTTEFFQQLITLLNDENILQLIILTSSYAYEKHLIDTIPFEYIANDSFKLKFINKLNDLKWNEYQQNNTMNGTDDGMVTLIHGSGFAQRLLLAIDGGNEQTKIPKQIPTMILFKYISEGDNRSDAQELIEYLNQLLNILPWMMDSAQGKPQLKQIQFNIPISWKLLFGNDAPENIY